VALLAGCAQQVLDPDINVATIEVLARNGVEVVVPEGQGCCGGLAWHTGDGCTAQALARRNLDAYRAGAGGTG
jgi:glycolate oxidase iron-sulfur subunit